MAQTFGAIVSGLAHYNDKLIFAGAIANVTGSNRHRELISHSMPNDIALLACLPKHTDFSLPHRHLGFVRPNEVKDIEQRLNAIAAVIAESELAHYRIPTVNFISKPSDQNITSAALAGIRIAIASDDAFSFIYAANLRLLKKLGAELQYFSPLHDTELPDCDAIWLPGGYPELYMHRLHNNKMLRIAIQQHFEKNKIILAECGGMLYVQKSLTDLSGDTVAMLGLIVGDGIMRDKGGCQGMQSAPLPEGEIRGHAHHHSRSENTLTAIAYGKRSKHSAPGEKIVRQRKLTASYLHLYFPSNPEAVIKLFQGDY
jgi:cobyrinic acid a,c-diamide synthase